MSALPGKDQQMSCPVKNRIISWVSQNFFDHLTYKVHNGLNKGLRRRGGLGWIPAWNDNPEIRFWKSLDLKDKVVYDVGAFHGLLTLYFARSARCVVAWEPNRGNRSRLEENLRLNSFANVIVRPYGLSSRATRAEMSFDPLTPGMASLDRGIALGAEHETIEVRTLDEEPGLDAPNLIKIDVEGLELEVLKGAVRTLQLHPELFLEMHGADLEDKCRRVNAIANYLWTIGYRNIRHVETGAAITPENASLAFQGHLYARA